jgi:hypothetical protein
MLDETLATEPDAIAEVSTHGEPRSRAHRRAIRVAALRGTALAAEE